MTLVYPMLIHNSTLKKFQILSRLEGVIFFEGEV